MIDISSSNPNNKSDSMKQITLSLRDCQGNNGTTHDIGELT